MNHSGLIQLLGSYITPLPKAISSSLCREASLLYESQVANESAWADRMRDSSAKLQAGLLTGNLNSLGDFDECINVGTVQGVRQHFKSQYCLAKVELYNGTAEDALGSALARVMQEESEIQSGLSSLISRGVRWAYCIPSTCSPSDLKTGLERHLQLRIPGANVTVKGSDCQILNEDQTPFSTEDCFAIVVISILLLLSIFCSIYDYTQVMGNAEEKDQECFSRESRERKRISKPERKDGRDISTESALRGSRLTLPVTVEPHLKPESLPSSKGLPAPSEGLPAFGSRSVKLPSIYEHYPLSAGLPVTVEPQLKPESLPSSKDLPAPSEGLPAFGSRSVKLPSIYEHYPLSAGLPVTVEPQLKPESLPSSKDLPAPSEGLPAFGSRSVKLPSIYEHYPLSAGLPAPPKPRAYSLSEGLPRRRKVKSEEGLPTPEDKIDDTPVGYSHKTYKVKVFEEEGAVGGEDIPKENLEEMSTEELRKKLSQEIGESGLTIAEEDEISRNIYFSKHRTDTPEVKHVSKVTKQDTAIQSIPTAESNIEDNASRSSSSGLPSPASENQSSSSGLPSPVKLATREEYDVLLSFSLFRNARNLFSFEEKPAFLRTLNGLKVLSLCWIILGYSLFITSAVPAINYTYIHQFTHYFYSMPIVNTQLAIETFLVCSGVLTSYLFLRDMLRREVTKGRYRGVRQWAIFWYGYLPLYYLHRFIRFTPALAVMILLQISLLNHLGSGPFWHSGNGEIMQVCRESWWGTLLYVQNYINPHRMCLSHSWYMMVDMQLYVFSPILLGIFLFCSKQRVHIIFFIICIVATLVNFWISWNYHIPAAVLTESITRWQMKTKYQYAVTHTRIVSWIIGLLTGYYLYHYRYKELKNPRMKQVHIYIGWTVAPLCMLYSVFGLYPFQKQYITNNIYNALYSSLFRVSWAGGISWIILACEMNHGGIVQDVLQLSIFKPLSKLTYTMYLVHAPLIMYRALITRTPIHINGMTTVSFFFGDVTTAMRYAIFLALLVELPIIRLYKAITINSNYQLRVERVRPHPDFPSVGERLKEIISSRRKKPLNELEETVITP